MSVNLSEQLKRKAISLGFSMVGIVAARPGRRLQAYFHWLSNAYHGQMEYMARPDRIARREDLRVILPDVSSIVCVGLDYGARKVPVDIRNDPSRGRISKYAWGADYHDVMLPRLQELGNWLSSQSNSVVSWRSYVDTGAILERDHGESARLGFTGKNTMLIAPRRGSWFFLGELLTSIMLEPDKPSKQMPGCGKCRRCLDACPTAAFPRGYVLDARRCISYLTIELKGWIPSDLRPLMGNWVYGCDICQSACPFNRFSNVRKEIDPKQVVWNQLAPPLLDLLELDEATFRQRFSISPIGRIGRTRLMRNAIVATGNWGGEAAVPALYGLLRDDEPVIRGHSVWALKRIRGNIGYSVLVEAQKMERDEEVLLEYRL